MAHFTKHWLAELVEEVKSVVCEHVSHSSFHMFVHIPDHTHLPLKFVERYNMRNAKEQDQVKCVCKVTVSPPKLGCWNINDTNLSSDDEDYPQASNTVNTYLEEWNLYLNMNEVVPDNIRIVGWWGVRHVL
jgi:hypothetical protein